MIENAGFGNALHDIKRKLRQTAPKPVSYASYLKALFENEIELRLLPWLCQKSATSIDVGAFTGTYSIGASAYSKNVIAVEPQQRQAQALRQSMPRNVTIVEAALSNMSGAGILKMESLDGGSMSWVESLSSKPPANSTWLNVPVQLKRMDDFENGPIGFVKIDAEGHEAEVIEGGSRMIAAERPMLLIECEERYQVGGVAKLVSLLGNFGYQGYFIFRDEIHKIEEFDAKEHQDIGLIVGGSRSSYKDYINNFIFVHQSRPDSLPRRVPSAPQAVFQFIRACCV